MASKIEQQVMASVGTIYMARQFLSMTALKLYVCVAALFGIAKLVWVARVFENFSQAGVHNALQFAVSALIHANLPVQIALLVFTVAGISLIRDLARLSTNQSFRLA